MSPSKLLRTGLLQPAGLVSGATLWAFSTQLGQILPYMDCMKQVHASALVAGGGAVISVIGGLVSWHFARSEAGETPASTGMFVGTLSGLAGFLFAFALAMQSAAGLVLSGCER